MVKVYSRYAMAISQGSNLLFADFEDQGPMWAGSGAREVRKRIDFEAPFLSIPVVNVSVSMWDFDNGTNQRGDIAAENIDPAGFELVFRTWGDTQVARIRADWIAFGEMHHPDDFEL